MLMFVSIMMLSVLSGCKDQNADNSPAITQPENKTTAEHVAFVLYDRLTESITAPITEKINQNYEKILGDMQLNSVSKITVEIWNDETHFQNDMKKDLGVNYPGATGYVYSPTTVRILYRGSAAQTALHEFCHAVSLHVNGNFGNNPRWFWEAVAIYEAGEFNNPKNISYLVEGNFPSIAELTSDFNTGSRKIYEVGYLLSEYIIDTWGKKNYVQMIKSNANIQKVLALSVSQFEDGWKEFVKKKYL
jgi:hypothetical protein